MGESFEIPSSYDQIEMHRKVTDIQRRIEDSQHLIEQTSGRLKEFLRDVQKISQHPQATENNISLIQLYKLFLNKEKQLFASLNKFKKGDKLFMGFGWIPKCE